jgi:hypothetical protein
LSHLFESEPHYPRYCSVVSIFLIETSEVTQKEKKRGEARKRKQNNNARKEGEKQVKNTFKLRRWQL